MQHPNETCPLQWSSAQGSDHRSVYFRNFALSSPENPEEFNINNNRRPPDSPVPLHDEITLARPSLAPLDRVTPRSIITLHKKDRK